MGLLCGLMPDSDSKPTSEQLNKVVDLLFGMGVNDEDGNFFSFLPMLYIKFKKLKCIYFLVIYFNFLVILKLIKLLIIICFNLSTFKK